MLGFSPNTRAAKNTLKKTCTCIINDAMPGVMPTCMPMNRNENSMANITSPYNTVIRNGTSGNFIKKTAGTLANKNRSAHNRSGEKSCKLNVTNKKLAPQITATDTANNK